MYDNEFKENFMKSFPAYLPEEYQSWELKEIHVPKVNGIMEGISMSPRKGAAAAPTLYFQDLYDDYEKFGDMEKVCSHAAEIFLTSMKYVSKLDPREFLKLPKENIVFMLISQRENETLLRQIPHRITLDFALIYRLVVNIEPGGINSAIITNALAEELGLDEEELYNLAIENTEKIFPAETQYVDGVFGTLTNQRKLMGASVMLYPGVLKEAAERMESNLFILPSSIHEVFVIPDLGQDTADLNRIVLEANNCVVEREEILSHHVYWYDREKDKVFIPQDEAVCS